MVDFIYYFLSSTAQVFGAILGIVGLFVVFRIEQLNKSIEDSIQYTGFTLALRYTDCIPKLIRVISNSYNGDFSLLLNQYRYQMDDIQKQKECIVKLIDENEKEIIKEKNGNHPEKERVVKEKEDYSLLLKSYISMIEKIEKIIREKEIIIDKLPQFLFYVSMAVIAPLFLLIFRPIFSEMNYYYFSIVIFTIAVIVLFSFH